MNINIWILMSASVTNLIRTRLEWDEEQSGEYRGPIGRLEHGIFSTMAHFSNVERMFKRPTISGQKRHLFNLNFTSETKAQEALDYLAANRAENFIIGGAWYWDGRQLGTEWEVDTDGDRTGTTGTPTYPLHLRLIDFMPDVVEHDDGNVISTTPATVLTDVNRIQGQESRRFLPLNTTRG